MKTASISLLIIFGAIEFGFCKESDCFYGNEINEDTTVVVLNKYNCSGCVTDILKYALKYSVKLNFYFNGISEYQVRYYNNLINSFNIEYQATVVALTAYMDKPAPFLIIKDQKNDIIKVMKYNHVFNQKNKLTRKAKRMIDQ